MHSVKSLVGRDSALSILLGGSLPGSDASMGHEITDRDRAKSFAQFGNDGRRFGADYGHNPHFGADGASREKMLYPNADSLAKIQKYVFAVNQTVVQQTAVAINATQNPQTQIRPQRVTCNAPAEGWGTLTQVQLANVNVTVGGTIDMFDFSARAQDAAMDLPTLSPANSVIAAGAYSGLLAPGYVAGANFIWSLSFKGPSNMVA